VEWWDVSERTVLEQIFWDLYSLKQNVPWIYVMSPDNFDPEISKPRTSFFVWKALGPMVGMIQKKKVAKSDTDLLFNKKYQWSDFVGFKQSKNLRSCDLFSVKPFFKCDEAIVSLLSSQKNCRSCNLFSVKPFFKSDEAIVSPLTLIILGNWSSLSVLGNTLFDLVFLGQFVFPSP